MGGSQSSDRGRYDGSSRLERVTEKDLGVVSRIAGVRSAVDPCDDIDVLALGCVDRNNYQDERRLAQVMLSEVSSTDPNGTVKLFVMHCIADAINLTEGNLVPKSNPKAKPIYFAMQKSPSGAVYARLRPVATAMARTEYLFGQGIDVGQELRTNKEWLKLDDFAPLADAIAQNRPVTCGLLAKSYISGLVDMLYPRGWVLRQVPLDHAMDLTEKISLEMAALVHQMQGTEPPQSSGRLQQ
jgi:hypothetical protein